MDDVQFVMKSKILMAELKKREDVIERFNALINKNNPNSGKPLHEEEWMDLTQLIEDLFGDLLEKKILNIYDLDTIGSKTKNMAIEQLRLLSQMHENIVPIINNTNAPTFLRCYLLLTLYLNSYEAITSYLDHFAQKVNTYLKSIGKPAFDASNSDSKTAFLKTFSHYNTKYSNLTVDLNPDLRGSIAHLKFNIIDDGKFVYFKYLKAKYSIEDLGMSVARLAHMIHSLLFVSAKIQANYLQSLVKQ